MTKRRFGYLGMAVALAVCGTACSSSKDPSPMAALEDAYKSGVLTKAEYDAKRAALQAPTQMAALDDAYKSGVLTKAEYDAKRSALLGAPAPLPALPAPPTPVPAPAPIAPATAQPDTPAPTYPSMPTQSVAQAAPAPAAPPRGNYLVFKKALVMDQYGFERPIPQSSMLLPVDWQYQGGTKWDAKNACTGTTSTIRATGPDGRAFEVFPAYDWVWADDPRPLQLSFQQTAQMGRHACDVMQPMGAADFLRRNLPRIRPGAQLVAMEPMPEYMQILQQQARQTEQSATQYGLTQRVRPDIIRGRLRYSVNGQAMEEWIVVTTSVTGTLGPSMTAQGQMTKAFSYSCHAVMFAERAPQGQLEGSDKFFKMLVNSIRINPEWQARVSKNSQAIFDSEHAEIAKRSAITTQLGNDLSNIRRQQAANQARSEDHVFAQYSDTTRGIETYRNPASGETWDISNQYGHAWVNNRNEIVVSDQEGWDPNVILKGDWTALQPVKK